MPRKMLRKVTSVGVAAILCSLALVGCTGEKVYKMKATAALPAAEGSVSAWEGSMDETVVEVDAQYLTPTEETKDPLYYTAWAKNGNTITRLGNLKLEGDRFGRLVSSTHMTNFEVMVTAEEKPVLKKPQSLPILTSTTIYSWDLT